MMDEPTRALTDDLALCELIGRGGFGEVHRAHQRSLDRMVAVKLIRADASVTLQVVSRFEREAHALSRIAHPHIVTIMEQGTTGSGELYLVMELLQGRPLSAMIAEGPTDSARVIAIGAQLADALAAAHSAGVIHRDLKPHNIFVRHRVGASKDFVTILDFGLARLSGQEPNSSSRSAGSTHYMSPEQILGEHGDARSDLHGLGLVLFELLAGRRPFPDDAGPLESLMQHVNDEPASLAALAPDAPPQLVALVHQLLAKDPRDRPPDAAAVCKSLVSGGTVGVAPNRPHRRQRASRAFAAAFGLAAVVALALGAKQVATTSPVEATPTPELSPMPAVTAEPAVVPVPRQLRPGHLAAHRARRTDEQTASAAWRIVTRPSGARVTASGVVLGVSPLWVSADLTPAALRVTKLGFESRTILLMGDRPPPPVVRLQPDRHLPPTR